MKPIRLQLSAFGPYGGREEVDFRALDQDLFLITGPIGAGKTSILDGICFALYGETSGGPGALGRDAKHMRSHFADEATPSEVTFEFELDGVGYRLYRPFEQARTKKAAARQGFAHPILWKCTPETPFKEGELVAETERKVDEKVFELLRLKREQFCQVALLPQGRFQTFLRANSSEREGLLKTLFRADGSERIQRLLQDEADKLAEQLGSREMLRETILKTAGIESGLKEDLLARHAELGGGLVEREARLADLRRAHDDAQVAFERARTRARLADERTRTEAQLAALATDSARVEAAAAELALARRALPLSARAEACARIETQLSAARAEAQAARVALESCEKRAAEAAVAWEKAQAISPKILEEEKQLSLLTEREPEIARLATLDRELAERDRELSTEATKSGEWQKRLDEIRKQIEILTARKRDLEDRALKEPTARHARELAEAQLARTAEHEREQFKLKSIEARVNASRAELGRAETAIAAERSELEAMESLWTSAQAALLAAGLRPGQACTVCGSTSHPAPAHAPSGAVPHAALQAKRDRLRVQTQSFETARVAHSALERDFDVARALVARLSAEMPSAEDRVAIEPARTAEADAIQAREALPRVTLDLGELLKREDLGAGKVQEIVARVASLRETRAAQDAERKTLRERLPTELPTPEALAAERGARAEALTSLKRAQEEARLAQERAQAALTGVRERVRAQDEHVRAAQAELASQVAELERGLAEAGFGSRRALDEARRLDEQMAALERRVQAHERALHAARERTAAVEEQLRGLGEAADLAQAEAVALESARALEDGVRALESGRAAQSAVAAAVERLASTEAEIAALEAEHRQVARLASVANGANGYRINFQRYLLASRLERVLEAASRRLSVMSRGRYVLQRTDGQDDKRKVGGLDLSVMDSRTGQSRPVASLSGGETFLASLALALGLSDVVQAQSGGVRLGTLFIDEGFGSLDLESLDLALDVLRELQQGDRLVGIISHVEELKRQVPTRIEIALEGKGSTIRMGRAAVAQ